MIVVKAIRPAKMKSDVFRLEFLTALHELAPKIETDYKKTTDTWKAEKPKFQSSISLQAPGPTLAVEASGEGMGVKKWNWIDKGTKKHKIPKQPKPANDGRLFFNKNFSPKTKPGFIGSFVGSSSGPVIVARQVQHPGTKPRNWNKAIQSKWKPKFEERMKEAMRRAAVKSGHAI